MKRFLLFPLLVFCVGVAAQLPHPGSPLSKHESSAAYEKMKSKAQYQAKSGFGHWFIPAWDILEDYYNGSMDANVNHYANVVWPDSVVKYLSGGETHAWLHSMGQVIDPYAPWFSTTIHNNVQNTMLDSIFLLGWYENVDGVFEDTLVFEVVVNSPNSNPAFGGLVNNNTGASYSAPKMQGSTAQFGRGAHLTDPGRHVIKHVLTAQDSTADNTGRFITVSTGGIYIPSGAIIGVNVTYAPGYSYNVGDTIFSYDQSPPKAFSNSIRYGFYGVIDNNAHSDLFLDPNNTQGHYNTTYLILNDGRYGLYNNVLDDHMYPYGNWGLDLGVYLNWTPYPVSVDIGADTTICHGASYQLNSGYGSGYDSYWYYNSLNGPQLAKNQYLAVDSAGTYYVRVVGVLGGQGVDSITISTYPSYNYVTYDTICYGDSTQWRGQWYSMPGMHTEPHTTTLGCDSNYVLDLYMHGLPQQVTPIRHPGHGYLAPGDEGGIELNNSFAGTQYWTTSGGHIASPKMDGIGGKLTLASNYQPGVYTVMSESQYGCVRNQGDVEFYDSGVGLENQNALPEPTIQPNPNPGSFTLICNKQVSGIAHISIYCTSGRLVHNMVVNMEDPQQEISIQMHDPSPGVYFLKLTTERGRTYYNKVMVY